jgi:hypothetical protein
MAIEQHGGGFKEFAPARTPRSVDSEPHIDPDELRAANERHDREHGSIYEYAKTRIRRSWIPTAYIRPKKAKTI